MNFIWAVIFSASCLIQVNLLRALHHNTPAVKWSDQLASDAQAWADDLARTNPGNLEAEVNKQTHWGTIYKLTDKTRKANCAEAILHWFVLESCQISKMQCLTKVVKG